MLNTLVETLTDIVGDLSSVLYVAKNIILEYIANV